MAKMNFDITDALLEALEYELEFGKHQGMKVKNLLENHPGYCAWMLEQPPSANLQFSKAKEMIKIAKGIPPAEAKDWVHVDTKKKKTLKKLGSGPTPKYKVPIPTPQSSEAYDDDNWGEDMFFTWLSDCDFLSSDFFLATDQEKFKELAEHLDGDKELDSFLIIKKVKSGLMIQDHFFKHAFYAHDGNFTELVSA